MKHKLSRMVSAALLAGVLAWGMIQTLLTAFNLLDLGLPVDGGRLLLWTGGAAVLSAVTAGRKFGWIAGMAPAAAAAVYLGTKDRLLVSLESLLFQITVPYHEAYKCGRIRWSEHPVTEGEASMMLVMLGVWMAWLTVRAVYGHERNAPVIMGVLTLLLCIGVPKVRPDLLPMVCLVGGMSLLLLLGGVTGPDNERTKTLGILAAPVLLSAVILTMVVPENGLDVMPKDFTAKVSSWFSNGFAGLSSLFRGDGFLSTTIFSEKVELDKLGARKESDAEVMTVSGAYTGRLYLRGMAYDVYTGSDWKASKGSWVMDGQYIQNGQNRVSMTIETAGKQKICYVPCYPNASDELSWKQGRVQNAEGKKTYTLLCTQEIRSLYLGMTPQRVYINGDSLRWVSYNTQLLNYDPEDMKQYLALPEDSEGAIRKILDEVGKPQKIVGNARISQARFMYDYAQRIRTYVQELATYDTDTGKMPKGEKDFAVWFMKKQDTGYCVHFATAATVLLRAAGIPARYVTGYMVNFPKDGYTTEVTVRQKDAHAWVEYWLPGVGWMILDATPAVPDDSQPTSSDRPSGSSSSQRPSSSSSQKPESSSSQRPDESSSERPGGSSSQRPGNSSSQRPGVSSGQGNGSGPDVSGSSRPDDDAGVVIPWNIIGRWMRNLLNILMIPAVLWGQWWVRRWYRRRRLHSGTPNRRARYYWKYCRQMAGLLRQDVPTVLRELTEKACFSNYTLTAEELAVYAAYLADGEARLRKKPRVLQVLYRLIFAVY